MSKIKVSIIVPVYNGSDTIEKLITSLLNQTYDRDAYEIIIVDNGSTDNTRQIVTQFPVRLLTETKIQSSYAARNTGIQAAKGNIIAFTDADCTAASDWLKNGIKNFIDESIDLVAGQVVFTFSKKCSAAEQWDSLIHMHNESSVKKGHAKTANLFVRKKIFKKIGNFPIVQSGGDVAWTSQAVQSNNNLVYDESAIVYHPTRVFTALMKKHRRVGGGSINAWRSSGKSWFWTIAATGSLLLPLVYNDVKNNIKNRGKNTMTYNPMAIMVVAIFGRWNCFFGIIRSLFVFKK